MAEVRDIKEYKIFGEGLEFDRVKRIHETVGDYRERLLKDHLLQDLLLNEGYKIEENRPVSYHDIENHIFNRIKTSLHLLAVEKITEMATRPRIYAVSGPVVIIPGEENEERWETAEGFDAGRIEEFQTKTFENPEAMKAVQEYKETLQKAFDEYNMQFVLGLMRGSKLHYIDLDWDVMDLKKEIDEIYDGKSFTALDSAYYNMGNRFFRSCSSLYMKLKDDEFGNLFILSPEEESKGIQDSIQIM